MVLKSSLLQQMAPDHLQVVRQPTRIRGNPSARLFATQEMVSANVSSRLFATGDRVKPSGRTRAQLPIHVQLVLPARFRVISANASFRLFAASDGVKSSVSIWAKLPIGVQLVLPARFRVILANISFRLFVASDGVRFSVHIWAKLPISVQLILPARFRVILTNVSSRQFVASDGVISAVHVWAKLPINVQLILPARFRVNPYAARFPVNLYAAHLRVNLYAAPRGVNLYVAHSQLKLYAAPPWVNLYNAHLWSNFYATPPWVNLYVTHSAHSRLYAVHMQMNLYAPYSQANIYVTCQWVNWYSHLQINMYCTLKWVNQCASYQSELKKQYATPQWVMILPVCFRVYNLPQFEGSGGSIWRDSTAQYNVADHPFFVFHPKPVDCSSFGETFKIYAHHLLQYRLVCVIEFVLRWFNHWCHFISKHACMLVNFDLTPQQHCQRAHLTMCRSQYRKHDFSIISSASNLQTNYTVVSFVKYLENIILQLKHICTISIRHSANKKIQTNNCFEFSEQTVPSKIGGGKHVEKFDMDVISPFIINTPPNVSDIEMCEFVDHLETSECLKKYSSSNHLLCNVPLYHFINYLFQPNRISIGNKHGIHIQKKMTKFEITNLFKDHEDVCKHEYLTVFRPYKQVSSSERKSNYRKKNTKVPTQQYL
jgi:hypothetical protein